MRIVKILSGNLLMALAYSFITVPNDIVNGGVTSLAMICAELLGLDVALCSNLFTVLLMIICAVFLGKSYFMGTVYSCIAYMALFTIFSHTGFELHIFRPAAAILAAVMVGAGYYLCMSARSTAIGFDTIALILNKKDPRINVAAVMCIINICVLIPGYFTFGLGSVLTGIMFAFVQSFTLNAITRLRKRSHAG